LSSGEKHSCPLEINNELRSRAIFFTWLTSGYCEQCEEGVIAVKLVKLCRVCCHQKWQPQDVNGNGVCSCSVMEKAQVEVHNVLLIGSQQHDWVFPLLPKMQQKLRMQIY
jgi:hypothetical protein